MLGNYLFLKKKKNIKLTKQLNKPNFFYFILFG